MNEVVSRSLRLIGWLLTPLVAGAAAFLGAWFGALLRPWLAASATGFLPMIVGGAVFSIGATVGWALLMRRSTGRE